MSPQQIALLNRYYGAPVSWNNGADDATAFQGFISPNIDTGAGPVDQSNIFRTQDDYYNSLIAGRGGQAPIQSNITVGGPGGRLVTDQNGRPLQGVNVGGIGASRYGNLVDLPTYNTMFGTNFTGYGGQDYGGDWRGNMDNSTPFDNLMGGLANAGIAYGSAGLGNAALNMANTSAQDQASANARSNSGVVDLGNGNSGANMPFYPGGNPGFTEGGGGGSLFDGLLGGLGNLSPAILAGYLGNSQRQDVMGQVGRLNDLAGSLSGPAFMDSITHPYDLQTGLGRNALTQNLQQRGVGGSSFGNQQLGNYDYQRGLGRGDLATRAQAGIAGTQGQLYSDALRGIVGGNAAYNTLLGAGLGASGSLFNRSGGVGSTGNGLFDWLRNLGGGSGSLGGSATDIGGGGSGQSYDGPPIDLSGGGASEFDPNIDWSNLYG